MLEYSACPVCSRRAFARALSRSSYQCSAKCLLHFWGLTRLGNFSRGAPAYQHINAVWSYINSFEVREAALPVYSRAYANLRQNNDINKILNQFLRGERIKQNCHSIIWRGMYDRRNFAVYLAVGWQKSSILEGTTNQVTLSSGNNPPRKNLSTIISEGINRIDMSSQRLIKWRKSS